MPPLTIVSPRHAELIQQMQDIIGTDAGNRGMKTLIVPGDLQRAAVLLAQLKPADKVILLSGFPLAQTCVALHCAAVTIVTDDCNVTVFRAAVRHLPVVKVESFPAKMALQDHQRLEQLSQQCDLLVACERAGPAADGICYTMRGISMEELVAPLHLLVQQVQARGIKFIAIGDGGNEMGMGKVLSEIHASLQIQNSVACVVPADCLIAASVSNWGGYALAAAVALLLSSSSSIELDECVPTPKQEVDLLERCIQCECRDGVSGLVEMTVDGMPLETSLQCLRDLRRVVLDAQKE